MHPGHGGHPHGYHAVPPAPPPPTAFPAQPAQRYPSIQAYPPTQAQQSAWYQAQLVESQRQAQQRHAAQLSAQSAQLQAQAAAETRARHRNSIDALSQKYWQDGSIGYTDHLGDGFYDLFGDFPEVADPGEFPSPLDALRKIKLSSSDIREVVVIDHEADHGLLSVEESLSEAMAEAAPQTARARIQVLATVVSERFGGVFDSEESVDHFWQQSSCSLKKRNNRTAVVHLCQLDTGGTRHRALLFKMLADAVKLQCRLVRGKEAFGLEEVPHAIVMVDQVEYVVDLLFEPGRLHSQEQFATMMRLKRGKIVTTSGAGNGGPAHTAAATPPPPTPLAPPDTASARSSTSGSSPRHVSGAAAAPGPVPPIPGPGAHPAGPSRQGALPGPSTSGGLVSSLSAQQVHSGSMGGGMLQSGGLGLGLGHSHTGHAPGQGPAIAGNRVRFVITDLPKGAASGPTGGPIAIAGPEGQSPPAQGYGGSAGGGLATAGPTGAQAAGAAGAASASNSGVAASSGSGTGRLAFLPPGKARSMLDLPSGGSGGGAVNSPSDLIRLDSEPLPPEHSLVERRSGQNQAALATSLPDSSGGSGTALQRSNLSLDQNGWVKFSGFGRGSREEARPSPLSGGSAAGNAAGASAKAAAAGAGAGAEGAASTSAAGNGAASASGASTPGTGGATLVAAPCPSEGSGIGVSKVTSASPFAHFMLNVAPSVPLNKLSGSTSNPLPGAQGPTEPKAQNNAVSSSGGVAGTAAMAHSAFQAVQQQQMQQEASAGLAPSLTSPLVGTQQQSYGGTAAPAAPVANGPQSPPLPATGAAALLQGQMPRQGSWSFTSSSFTGPTAGQQQQATRQQQAGSFASALRPAVANGMGAQGPYAGATGAGVGLGMSSMTAMQYTPAGKSPAQGDGSKAPSPGLSTPFATPGSTQSTPPGSGPPAGGHFAELSPFGRTSNAPNDPNEGPNSTGRRTGTAPPGMAGTTGPDGPRDQGFFADLSPFNTGGGSSSAGGVTASGSMGGSGDRRDSTPAGPGHHRRTSTGAGLPTSTVQPIIEYPSSNDGSRNATPRVSFSSMQDPRSQELAAGQGGSGMGMGVQVVEQQASGGQEQDLALAHAAEVLTAELARMAAGGSSGGSARPEQQVVRMGPSATQRQQAQQGQAGGQVGAGQVGPHTGQGQGAMGPGGMPVFGQPLFGLTPQQQQAQQAAFAWFNAAMASPDAAYYQQYIQQAMNNAAVSGMVPTYYMPPGGPAMGQGGPGGMPQGMPWRPPAMGPGGNPAMPPGMMQWMQQQQQYALMQQQQAHQQMQPYMGGPSPFVQHQQQQTQQQQQVQAQQQMQMQARQQAPVGMGGAALEQRVSVSRVQTTTTVIETKQVVASAAGGGQAGGSMPTAFGMPGGTSTAPSPFGMPGAGPHAGGSMPTAFGMPAPRPPGGPHQPTDISHEMTVPSQQRLAALALPATPASDGGAAPLSPLALQPTLSASMPLPSAYRDLEIESTEITFGQRIGMGSYGEVFRGTWRGTDVAIKRFLEQNLSPSTIKEFRDEVMIMSKLRHPNIVLFMGAVTRSNQLAIVTQYVQRGSLFRLLHRTKVELDPRRRLSMALDIAKGMEYLHNCKPVLVHRDLKSPNLLVDRDWTVKVCDFGLSQVKMNTFLTAKSQGGSPAWMAPEILRNERCDEKSDVFSFGVILYELLTGQEPWEDLNPMQVVGTVGFHGQRMELPKDLDPAVTALVKGCWAEKPTDRPSFGQILATLQSWTELRPTARVLEQQAALAKQRQQRANGGA